MRVGVDERVLATNASVGAGTSDERSRKCIPALAPSVSDCGENQRLDGSCRTYQRRPAHPGTSTQSGSPLGSNRTPLRLAIQNPGRPDDRGGDQRNVAMARGARVWVK